MYVLIFEESQATAILHSIGLVDAADILVQGLEVDGVIRHRIDDIKRSSRKYTKLVTCLRVDIRV